MQFHVIYALSTVVLLVYVVKKKNHTTTARKRACPTHTFPLPPQMDYVSHVFYCTVVVQTTVQASTVDCIFWKY
jgi:hypothetical protein